MFALGAKTKHLISEPLYGKVEVKGGGLSPIANYGNIIVIAIILIYNYNI